MSTVIISRGVTSSGLSVSGGELLEVFPGAVALDTTVLSGGVFSAFAGSTVEGLVVSAGGSATIDQYKTYRVSGLIDDGGELTFEGAHVSAVTVVSAGIAVQSEGTAVRVSIAGGGVETLAAYA